MVPDEDITFIDGCMAPTPRTCSATAGISTSAAPTVCLPTSWPWWWTMPAWAVTEVGAGRGPALFHRPAALSLSSAGSESAAVRPLSAPAGPGWPPPVQTDGDQSLENLRAKYTAEEIVGRLAFAYGLQPEPAPRTPESLIPDFSWDKVPKQDIYLPENLF